MSEVQSVPPNSADPAAENLDDNDIRLLCPSHDAQAPEFSIVAPALNEQETIADFVKWCRCGLASARVVGEILIVDSSSDRTAEIALEGGARVLNVPRRGLGRAYIDALPFIRGMYVILGDTDCTYDFRHLVPFVEKLREGHEFVMGSRFRGSIESGAMPALHRYLGTPVTTWVLNRLYSSHFTDIHCGMRGITRDALKRMDLRSQSWEYASEMVVKSVRMRFRTAEVPVNFLKDREGRLSHHKRTGWWSPWHAAWTNLRAMFIHGADFFVLKPGIVLLALGLATTLPLSMGPITVGRVTFSLYWMLLGVTLSILGLQSFFLGCLAQTLYDYTGDARRRWLRLFPYTRTVLLSGGMFVSGAVLAGLLIAKYVRFGLSLPPGAEQWSNHLAVMGLLLMIAGFMTFTFTLLLQGAATRPGERHDES